MIELSRIQLFFVLCSDDNFHFSVTAKGRLVSPFAADVTALKCFFCDIYISFLFLFLIFFVLIILLVWVFYF